MIGAPEPVSISQPMPARPEEQALRRVAKELETSFLSEMLKAARFGEPRRAFGGGIGEDHFASFLRDEVARSMVENGGLGLSEQIFATLRDRNHAAPR